MSKLVSQKNILLHSTLTKAWPTTYEKSYFDTEK